MSANTQVPLVVMIFPQKDFRDFFFCFSSPFGKYFLYPQVEKKVFALSFVYLNSRPVILTALPAVMVASSLGAVKPGLGF